MKKKEKKMKTELLPTKPRKDNNMTKKEWYEAHKEVLRSYYEDDAEVEDSLDGDEYIPFSNGVFNIEHLYRVKQATHLINGIEVPAPMRKSLNQNQPYFVTDIYQKRLYSEFTWNERSFDKGLLGKGLVHLSKESAIANAKAILSILTEEKKDV
jgi:hypothetical protein